MDTSTEKEISILKGHEQYYLDQIKRLNTIKRNPDLSSKDCHIKIGNCIFPIFETEPLVNLLIAECMKVVHEDTGKILRLQLGVSDT